MAAILTSSSASAAATYSYDPLPTAGHSRILKLDPGTPSQPLTCSLETLRLKNAPQYEALSYAWGNPDRNFVLTCDGKELRITESLDKALRRLRHPKHLCTLWIDQLCIDQENVDERSQQVQIMRDIYSSASQVLSWLGPDDHNQATLAKELIAKLSTVEMDEHARLKTERFPHFPEDQELVRLGLPKRASSTWRALDTMLRLPYFERIWIVQEVEVASGVTMLSGRRRNSVDRLSNRIDNRSHPQHVPQRPSCIASEPKPVLGTGSCGF